MVIGYDLQALKLDAWARAVFDIDRLEELHLLPDPQVFANYVERLNYRVGQLRAQSIAIHQALFIIRDEILVPLVGKVAMFQVPPSFRCHLAGAGTASAFHCDGDPKYGIARNSLNLWIPLTTVSGNNSLYIEQCCGAGDYHALSLKPGEMLLFDAYHLSHGSKANDTQDSRVSLDIRFVPEDIGIARRLGFYAR